jgi:hypothetical protein
MGEMRISGLGALTMGMILLNRADAHAEEDATLYVTKALNIACGPWMSGGDAKALAETLEQDGWDKCDMLFARTGPWGAVALALLRTNERRICRIHMRTNEEPWTTVAATTLAQAWIASRYPAAEKLRSGDAIINGKLARTTLWHAGRAKITMTALQSKQASPDSDFILEIESV